MAAADVDQAAAEARSDDAERLGSAAPTEIPLKFYIFGHPVALSASPTIQNTGFRVNGRPYEYLRHDTESVEDVVRMLKEPMTGGGSVTVPHKQSIIPFMDEVSEAARAIGAVNTVTKDASTGKLLADNTDWLGITRQLQPKMEGHLGERVGLIIGAGGTARAAAYAFRSLSFARVYVLNRTLQKAQELAEEFGDSFVAVDDAKELEGLARLDAVMGVIPGTANFTLPDSIMRTHRPAVVEAAYRSSESGSRFTPLLTQAIEAECETIEGIEMLFEQGCAQCEIWTGKPAPRRDIAQALLDDRFKDDANKPKNLLREAGLEP